MVGALHHERAEETIKLFLYDMAEVNNIKDTVLTRREESKDYS